MSPKSLAAHPRGLSQALLAALNVSILLNLGAFFSSVRILTRGTREYSTPYRRLSPLASLS